MAKLAFNLPLNSTSLGQVSLSILRELFSRREDIYLFPIGAIDIASQEQDQDFLSWIQKSIVSSTKEFNRKNPIFKLWHLNGSLESYSDKQILLTFYEVDSPTTTELNIIKNNHKVLFSSQYAVNTFKNYGSENVDYLPLAFDNHHFKILKNKPKKDGIYFGLFGKLEPQRKRHLKVIANWVKKYGNKHGYYLNCAIFNPFLDTNLQTQILNQALNGQRYWNINFLPFMQTNSTYNELLNNTDIVLAMSGGEGWGLPEFQSVALGKHCIALNAHAYKEWANDKNSILVNPDKKIPCYDNIFFKEGLDYNQGNIFDWDDNDFLKQLDNLESRYNLNPINEEGVNLQKEFTYKKMVDSIIELMNKV